MAVLLIQGLLGLCLLASWVYWILCLDSARRWARGRASANGSSSAPTLQHSNTPSLPQTPPVSILKPLCGDDPELHANLESFCRQDYPEYQVAFGALDGKDSALETARQIAGEHPERQIDIVAGGEVFGANLKVCNLEGLRRVARYELLILADSDMRVGSDYLRRVVAPFADPAVGLVTCVYRGCKAVGLSSALEALGIAADFIPSVLLANRFWGARFAFGSTIAVRAGVLESMGGFRALADELGDDYMLAQGAIRAGYRVVLSDYVVDDVLGSESFREMWGRRLRWARTTRALNPAGWAGTFITHGTALGILFLAATGFGAAGWLVFGFTLALRAVTASGLARLINDRNLPGLLPLLPISDLVTFGLWGTSFLGNTVAWRGERYRVGRTGRIERVSRPGA